MSTPLIEGAFRLYSLCWRVAIPLLKRNRRIAEGFDQRTLRRGGVCPSDIWIQCASAGESLLAVEILKTLTPPRDVRLLLTSGTSQGMDILQKACAEIVPGRKHLTATTAYFPFDRPEIMEKAVKTVNPRVMVLLETEIWPGLLRALKKASVKTLLVNGRITPKSLGGYMRFSSLWPELSPDRILAISREDADRFARLFRTGEVEVMSNIKFDRVTAAPAETESAAHDVTDVEPTGEVEPTESIASPPEPAPDTTGEIEPATLIAADIEPAVGNTEPALIIAKGMAPGIATDVKSGVGEVPTRPPDTPAKNPLHGILPERSPFIVLGSVRREEETVVSRLLATVLKQRPGTVIGLFPRHMERLPAWEEILKESAGSFSRRSALREPVSPGSVILWDTFGELSGAYSAASAAFVGGSLAPLGGQNFLEPLSCGVIPVIGPHWKNFSWVGEEIVYKGLLKIAPDWETAAGLLIEGMDSPPSRKSVVHKTGNYLKSRQGGTIIACDAVNRCLQGDHP